MTSPSRHEQRKSFSNHTLLSSKLVIQDFLSGYTDFLSDISTQEGGQRDLIALYAGALGDNAVERYAAFLVSLGLSADYTERRQALTRASEHGLDVQRVAIAAAERTIESAFASLPQNLRTPLPSVIARQEPASPLETLLLRSVEWTTFFEHTHATALEQATVILRHLLGSSFPIPKSNLGD